MPDAQFWLLPTGQYLVTSAGANYAGPEQQGALISSPMGRADRTGLASESLAQTESGGQPAYAYPSGALYLSILSVSTNVSLAINNAVGGTTYEIQSTTNLALGAWLSEGTVVGISGASTPTTVTAGSRTNLFLRVRSCDGGCGHTLPISYELANFEQTGVDPDGDYDSDGSSNYSEFLAGTDPNTIAFSAHLPVLYVGSNSVPGWCQLTGGVPARMAVLVNSTNFAAATWQPYGSNFVAELLPADSRSDIWVGLRGILETSQPAWRLQRITYETAPALFITNPAPGTISKPTIQLRGYTTKPLVALRFDLTNSTGALSNQVGAVVAQSFDTSRFDATTNWFSCLDIPLAPGTNLVTLRATGRAGAVAVTNLVYVFDTNGDTTPPAIAVTWPQDGAIISGANFTVRGLLDDETAIVTAWITSTNGTTNALSGVVERSGKFWVQNLPLSSGTNWVTLTAIDAAGNSATTNLTLVRSPISLVIYQPSPNDLYRMTATLTGRVSDPTYQVTVNGIQAAVDWGGSWTASDVPVNQGGTATFTAVASPPSGGAQSADGANSMAQDASASGDDACQATLDADKPPRISMSAFHVKSASDYGYSSANGWYHDEKYTHNHDWTERSQGNLQNVDDETDASPGTPASRDVCTTTEIWPMDTWCPQLPVQHTESCTDGHSLTNNPSPGGFPGAGGGGYNASGSWDYSTLQADGSYLAWTRWESYSGDQTIEVNLSTGGKDVAGNTSLFILSGNLFEVNYSVPYVRMVRRLRFEFGTLGPSDTNGQVYAALAEGQNLLITPAAPGVRYTQGDMPTFEKYTPHITANSNNLENTTPEFCVGQKVTLQTTWTKQTPTATIDGAAPPNVSYQWKILGPHVNKQVVSGLLGESPTYVIDPSLETNSTTPVWFSDGGINVATLDTTVQVGDQSATASVHGYVKSYRPVLANFQCDAPRWFTNGSLYLKYGDREIGVGGMKWHSEIQSKYEGRFGVTQIYHALYVQHGLGERMNTLGFNVADGGEWYNTPEPYRFSQGADQHTVNFSDFPACPYGVDGAEILVSRADDYIRFKPGTNENDANFYVTLGIVEWNAHGDYYPIGGWSANSTPEASHPNGWSDFPLWVGVIESPDDDGD
jgi:hypothetical protein